MSSPVVKYVKNPVACTLGEGPHWDTERQEVLSVDIVDQLVLRYCPRTATTLKVKIDEGRVSLACPVSGKEEKYIIAVEREIKVLDWEKPGDLKRLYEVDTELPKNRLNDGKCDPRGRLWAGTMGNEVALGEMEMGRGSLYSFDLDGKAVKHFDGIDCSNGLSWSPDGLTMYYIDSFAYTVDAFACDMDEGTIGDRRTVYDFKATHGAEYGIPDGMTTDGNGNIWVAMHDGSKVVQIDPRAQKQIQKVDFPTKNMTSVAFGGPHLDILYATSARRFLTSEELSSHSPECHGALFEVTNLGVKGIAGGWNYAGPL